MFRQASPLVRYWPNGARFQHRRVRTGFLLQQFVLLRNLFQGKTAWDGLVEVFHLHGQPKTGKVYVWMPDTDDLKKTGSVMNRVTHFSDHFDYRSGKSNDRSGLP